MTKPNQKVKDTAIKILEDIGRLTYERTYKGKHEGRIVEAMLKSVEKHIDSALTNQRKELKLKAQAIGTPDRYVNIENLFEEKEEPDWDLVKKGIQELVEMSRNPKAVEHD